MKYSSEISSITFLHALVINFFNMVGLLLISPELLCLPALPFHVVFRQSTLAVGNSELLRLPSGVIGSLHCEYPIGINIELI